MADPRPSQGADAAPQADPGPRSAPPPFEPDPELIGYIEEGQTSPNEAQADGR
jgi:hypothetical protein